MRFGFRVRGSRFKVVVAASPHIYNAAKPPPTPLNLLNPLNPLNLYR